MNGRLYLNYNAQVREEWSKNVPGYIGKADQNWPDVARTTKVFR